MRQLWCWLRRSTHPRWLPSSLRLACANKLTERNYAQIEKECQAIVFAAERFEHYILGKDIAQMLSAYKPLTSIYANQSWQAPNDFSECASDCRITLWKWCTSLVLKCSSVTRYHEPQAPCVELKQICLITWSFKFMKKKNSDRWSKKQIWKKQPSSETNASSKFATEETNKDASLQTLMALISAGWPDDKLQSPFVYASTGLKGMKYPLKVA